LTHDTKYGIINRKALLLSKGVTMPDIDKIIQKMKRQPNGIRFQELAKVLEYNGYKMKTKKRDISQKFY